MSARPEQLTVYEFPDRGRRRRSSRPGPRARPRALRAPATLAQVCADVGPELLDVAIAPEGLDVAVTDVLVHDPFDPPGVSPRAGQILLAVGASSDEALACDLLDVAAAHRAAAVVCKQRGALPDRLVAAADAAGIALLTTASEVSWGELYDLLRAAMATDENCEIRRRVARGRLSGLVDATAVMAAGAVRIEDLHGRVLAFSQIGTSHEPPAVARAPEEWLRELRRRGVFERLLASEDAVELELSGATPCRAIAIRAGETMLGVLWLCNSSAPAGETDGVLRTAAGLAALQLLRDGVVDDLERRVHAGMLEKVLGGHAIADAELERLGLAAATGYVVTAIEAGPIQAAGPVPPQERLVDLAVLHLQAYRCVVAATVIDGRCYVLAACDGERQRSALRRTLEDFVNRASRSLRTDLRVGIGKRAKSAAGIVDSRRAADRCVELGEAPNRVVAYEDIHGRALVADVQGFLAAQSVPPSQELALLREHDRDNGTDYIPTLRAFLDALGEASAAAARLGIHVNTLRYRMRRIIEITGADFADSDARFALELELRTLTAR